jgi:ribosomal protein S18 acetylase RimI-like enzyme
MERELPRAGAATPLVQYRLRLLSDRAHIKPLLDRDRVYAAYALGQLEHSYFHLSDWWFAESQEARALVLHSKGGLGEALFTLGDAPAIDAVLTLHPGPLRTFVTCRPEHLDAVKKHFFMSQQQHMIRMAVRQETFVPGSDDYLPRRLRALDVRDLNHLYGSDGGATFYTSWHLEEGVYYGIFEGRRLVAAAGTHVVAPTSGIAVVGNVFTHPARRRMGHAQAVTAAVTQELLKSCEDIVLTVDPANTPAVAAYRRLGYREQGRLIEAAAVRKDVTGLSSRFRRFLARTRADSRSSGERVEVISRRLP